jgi:hypothetical protein
VELERVRRECQLGEVSWLPDDFFIGHPNPPEARPHRPIGQGDVFRSVPIAGKTAMRDGQVGLKAKVETVIVVASSCGMRKARDGALNDVIHVAPIKRLASLAPGWGAPWDGHLHVLPLPGLALTENGDPVAANLSRIGLCGTKALASDHRVASVSLNGMGALKARLASYFVRVSISEAMVRVGAHEEWHELDLWERWITRAGDGPGFQEWLSEENPNYPGRQRRETLYDDLVGIREQLDEAS